MRAESKVMNVPPLTKPTLFLLLVTLTTRPALAQKPLDRTSLPIPEPDYPHSTALDARDTKPPPRFEVKAPVTTDYKERDNNAFTGKILSVTVDVKPIGAAVKAQADEAKREARHEDRDVQLGG
jgi:hypothetical protein